MERKAFQATDVTPPDADAGIVEAIVSVTGNVDLGGDLILPGAFKQYVTAVKSGQRPLPPILWQHDPSRAENVLGKVDAIDELMPGDPRLPSTLKSAGYGGLLIRASYAMDTAGGRLAYSHVKAQRVTEWSFAFEAPDRSFDAKGNRLLKTINPVYEVSNVIVGMNPLTSTLSAKALNENLKPWMLLGIQLAMRDARKDARKRGWMDLGFQIALERATGASKRSASRKVGR